LALSRLSSLVAPPRGAGSGSVPPKIRDFTPTSLVDGCYLAVLETRRLQKKDGAPFVRARLRDDTGTIEAVAWDRIEECQSALVPGTVVKVRGQIGKAFNGSGLELTIRQVRAAREEEFDRSALLPQSSVSVDERLRALRDLVDTLRPEVRTVVWAALEDVLVDFATWPAAQELHHAWIGGLLEHSLEVARLAEAIVNLLPVPDRDVTLAGALLHDLGKLDTYRIGAAFEPTDAGRLLGHVLTGYHRVQLACEAAQASPELSLRLLHVVASHHGRLEYEAVREPMTAEAIVVHFADELSAQLNQVRNAAAERSDGARWLDRVKGLKRDVFIGG
jgi:3'-5' exoribonuclease